MMASFIPILFIIRTVGVGTDGSQSDSNLIGDFTRSETKKTLKYAIYNPQRT
jgi:hypothetical protein